MNHLRRSIAVATSLFGTFALAGTLAGYSPIACGCLTPWEELADRINMPRDSWRSATAEKVRAGFEKSYQGTKITWQTLPPKADCSVISGRQVRCTNWLWEKLNPQSGLKDLKGYEITILVTRESLFESVQVDDIETPPQE